jgi:chaperonin cofactor prefoldin
MTIGKFIAAGMGTLLLTVAVVPFASAQDTEPLPLEDGAEQVESQFAHMGFQNGERNQGQNKGQFLKNKLKNKKDQWGTLSLEEKKEMITNHIDKASERLSERLTRLSENNDMDATVKQQLTDLINQHLANLPTYKANVSAAADEDALKAAVQEMREDGKALMDFMKENRPTKEEMQAKWDALSFEEKQTKILENLNRASEHLNEKLSTIGENTELDEEQKAKITEHLNERLAEVNSAIEKVSAASSDEELEALKDEIRPKKGQKRGPGNGGQGIRGPQQ